MNSIIYKKCPNSFEDNREYKTSERFTLRLEFLIFCFWMLINISNTHNEFIVPVDAFKNSVDVIGVGVATRFRLRSSFAHDNKLKIDDKTMTIATFIFAVFECV